MYPKPLSGGLVDRVTMTQNTDAPGINFQRDTTNTSVALWAFLTSTYSPRAYHVWWFFRRM